VAAAVTEAIRIRARVKNGLTEAKVLLVHPMETGLRKDAAGQAIAARYITSVEVWVGSRQVLGAALGRSVSRDPLLHFRFRGAQAGDRLRVSWIDNLGAGLSEESIIEPA
jgi:sulfur-oxidizing protein SoxZ